LLHYVLLVTTLTGECKHHQFCDSQAVIRQANVRYAQETKCKPVKFWGTRVLLYPCGRSCSQPMLVANCHISGRYWQRQSQLFSLWRHWRL